MEELNVICPTYKNSKYLDLFLRSAVEGKKLNSTKIFVSVDGFYDQSKEVLEKYSGKIQILDLGKNMGMQTAINLAVYQTQGNPNLLIVNDDNVLAEGYDEHLSSQFLSTKKTVYTVEQVEPTEGMFGFTAKDFGRTIETFEYDAFQKFAKENQNDKTDDTRGRIFPYLISKRNFMAVNGFDVLYNSPNLCDWDHFLKLELMGLEFKRTWKSIMYHFGSISTKVNSESHSFREREAKAVETFRYKWGFLPSNGRDNTKIPINSWLV